MAGKYKTAPFYTAVEAYKRDLIGTALIAANGDHRDAARRLGISYHYLNSMLRRNAANPLPTALAKPPAVLVRPKRHAQVAR